MAAALTDTVESRQKLAAIAESAELFEGYPELMTPAHIAELTGFTVQYVRKLCREHKLPAVQIGARQWFVPKPRFIEYVMAGAHD